MRWERSTLPLSRGRGGFDVDVADAAVEDVPVEAGLELGAVVGLDRPRPGTGASRGRSRRTGSRSSGRCGVDPQHADAGAVIDRGVLVVLLAGPGERFDELDVDLDAVAGQRFLVAFPASVVALVALRGRQPVQVEALEDAPHAGLADRDVVVALEVHRDLERPEVVVLAQVHDLADDLGLGLVRGHGP